MNELIALLVIFVLGCESLVILGAIFVFILDWIDNFNTRKTHVHVFGMRLPRSMVEQAKQASQEAI